MAIIDIGGNVRQGEELDIQAVESWLKNQQVVLQGQVQVTQYSGGASNWTRRMIWHVSIMCKTISNRSIQYFLRWWRCVRMSR